MLVKSRYTYEISDNDNNIILCNFLYKSRGIIHKEDKETIAYYKEPNIQNPNNLIQPFLENGIFVEDNIDEYKLALLAKQEVLYEKAKVLNITIKPTVACNLSCIYCWQNEVTGNMSQDVVERVIKFINQKAKDVEKIVIDWFGGEPMLMFPTIIKIMEAVDEISKKYKIPYLGIMSSNGTLLTSEKMKKLLSCHVYSYQITLDGTKELHDKCRPAKDRNCSSFDMIISNLKDIRDNVKQKYLEIVVRVNITKQFLSCKDEFIDLYKTEFANDNRFSLLFEDVTNKGGDKIKKNPSCVFEGEMPRNKIVADLLSSNIMQHNFMSYEHGAMMCNSLQKNSFNINYDGMIYMCELLSDKENTKINNNLSWIDEEGNINIDRNVLAYWHVNDEITECKECKLFPICCGGLCPLNMKKANRCHYQNNMGIIDNSLRALAKEGRLPSISLQERKI